MASGVIAGAPMPQAASSHLRHSLNRSPWAPAAAPSPNSRRRVASASCRATQKSAAEAQEAAAPTAGSGASDALHAGSGPPASRRGVLQLATAATVGGLHAWGGRAAAAADAAAVAEAAGGGASAATALERTLEQRLSEFTLPNGLRFIVYERHTAPIAAFHIYADVGAYDEVDGQTGLAHLLEHMAFKGTARIGSTDYKREAPLLDALDECFYTLQSMGGGGSGREAAAERQRFEALQKQAAALSVPNAYGALLSREGGVGLNAATSHDSTKYYVSLPSNKLELWFALEAERFQAPVFRELYSEKAVVFEERRLRVDNAPLGPFNEEFALRSFSNNYRRPVIGFPQDLELLGRREVEGFFREHYGPQQLTIAVAGDVTPGQVRRLAERYFGGWQPSGRPAATCGADGVEEPLPLPAAPPSQWEYRARSVAGPAVLHAYFRPCVRSPDSLPLDLASDLLSGTRSARLYRSLVERGRALSAAAYAAYPAEKHPSHFVAFGVPVKGSSLERLDGELSAEIAALAGEGPTADELRRYKKAARMELLDALGSNGAVAGALASYDRLTGDWRNVLGDLQRIESIEAAEVRDAAGRWLRPDNKFTGYVVPT